MKALARNPNWGARVAGLGLGVLFALAVASAASAGTFTGVTVSGKDCGDGSNSINDIAQFQDCFSGVAGTENVTTMAVGTSVGDSTSGNVVEIGDFAFYTVKVGAVTGLYTYMSNGDNPWNSAEIIAAFTGDKSSGCLLAENCGISGVGLWGPGDGPAVPEPTAALVFALGFGVVSRVVRRKA